MGDSVAQELPLHTGGRAIARISFYKELPLPPREGEGAGGRGDYFAAGSSVR